MKCPVCKSVSLVVSDLGENLPTRTCEDCGGRWIKSVEYLKWLDRHGENLPEKPPAEGANLPVHDSKPGKLCPECGAFLIRHKVGHEIEFHLDRCGHCGGIWLDGNEWETLKSRNLHDDVHFIFSEAWQTQVKQQERREEYRQVVTRTLDAKLLQQCAEADLARLKEFKAWLDEHPNSRELYGYLMSTRDL